MTNPMPTDAVLFADGSRGLLLSSPMPTDPNAMVEVMLDSGQRIFLPLDTLILQEEGGHRVSAHPQGFVTQEDGEAEIIIPLVAETLSVGKREVETGKVRFRTTVTERIETVDEPLLRTEVTTQRVVLNQFIDSMPAVRYEGETMIIPILEEVLVVEKRLRLKEEVYITPVQTEYRDPRSVTLRSETLIEERVSVDDFPRQDDETKDKMMRTNLK